MKVRLNFRFSLMFLFALMLAVPLWAAETTRVLTPPDTVLGINLAAEWAKYIGVALPAVIAFVLGQTWKTWLKALVSFAVLVLVSTGACYFENRLDLAHWPDTLIWIVTTAGASFWMFWRPLGIAQWIEAKFFPKGLLPFAGVFWNKIDDEARKRDLDVNYRKGSA